MAQQTAVKWLIEFIQDHCIRIDEKVIEQAKAMEKEQIMHAYWNGTTDMEKPDAMNDADKFYNEYYGA